MGDERRSSLLAQQRVTRREAEVLDALTERLTNAEIAARLYCRSARSSRTCRRSPQLGVRNRVELGDLAQGLRAAQGPDRAPSLPAPLALLADPAHFVGRQRELDKLRRLWHRAGEGHSFVGLVAGENRYRQDASRRRPRRRSARRRRSGAVGLMLPGPGRSLRAVRPGDQRRRGDAVDRGDAPTGRRRRQPADRSAVRPSTSPAFTVNPDAIGPEGQGRHRLPAVRLPRSAPQSASIRPRSVLNPVVESGVTPRSA
jgi:DNA-binding CsgD family transcriptional regulator